MRFLTWGNVSHHYLLKMNQRCLRKMILVTMVVLLTWTIVHMDSCMLYGLPYVKRMKKKEYVVSLRNGVLKFWKKLEKLEGTIFFAQQIQGGV